MYPWPVVRPNRDGHQAWESRTEVPLCYSLPMNNLSTTCPLGWQLKINAPLQPRFKTSHPKKSMPRNDIDKSMAFREKYQSSSPHWGLERLVLRRPPGKGGRWENSLNFCLSCKKKRGKKKSQMSRSGGGGPTQPLDTVTDIYYRSASLFYKSDDEN